MSEAIGWAGKLLSKDKTGGKDAPPVDFETTVEEKTNEVILAGMERFTQGIVAGELSQEENEELFAMLMRQLKAEWLYDFCEMRITVEDVGDAS